MKYVKYSTKNWNRYDKAELTKKCNLLKYKYIDLTPFKPLLTH